MPSDDARRRLAEAIRSGGPHTAESLGAALPGFPLEAIQDALATLAAAGVLSLEPADDGAPQYRYVGPDRYVWANRDVVVDPAGGGGRSRG